MKVFEYPGSTGRLFTSRCFELVDENGVKPLASPVLFGRLSTWIDEVGRLFTGQAVVLS